MLKSASTATTEVVSDYLYDSGWVVVDKNSSSNTYMFSAVTPTVSSTQPNIVLVDYIPPNDLSRSEIPFNMQIPTGSTNSHTMSSDTAFKNYNSFSLRQNTNYPYESVATSGTTLRKGVPYRFVQGQGSANTIQLRNGEYAYSFNPVPADRASQVEINFYAVGASSYGYHSARVRILTLDKANELFKEI